MADQKVTDRAALSAAPASGDLLHIIDVSDTTDNASGTSKKITMTNLFTSPSLTTPALGTPASGVLTNATGYVGDSSLTTLGTIGTGVWQGTAVDGAYVDIEGTEIKSTGEGGGTKYLREDGDGTCSWQTPAGSGDLLADGTVPMTADFNLDGNNIDNGGVIFLKEQAEADADVAGSGQIWVDTQSPNKLFFTDDGGTDYDLINPEGTAISSTGEGGGTKFLREDGDGTCSWQTPGGGGNVSNTGTPVNNQLAVWTDATTVEGDADLTYNSGTTYLNVGGGTTGNFSLGGVSQLTNASGTTTLQNIDAIDATTEATLEAAIDSLTNLTVVGTVVTGNVDAVVSASSTTTAGKVELATTAETDTGTDTGRAVTPDGLAGSVHGEKIHSATVFDYTTDTATGDGKYYFHIPSACNGMNLVYVHAEVITAGTTGTTDIQIANVTQAADMLSTKLTIDSAETGSDTAAAAAVIDTANDDVATNDVIRVDVDAVSTTAAKGLIVTMGFQLP